jgi:hypothetical protein
MGSTSFVKFIDTQKGGCFSSIAASVNPNLNIWDAARDDYNARLERGRAFCTLNRQEQVEIVRKYVNR